MKLEELVNKSEGLNDNDIYIWQYIYHHQRECCQMTIHEVARECNVSHTSINRFAKKIGLDGYGELKVYLKMNLKHQDVFDHHMISNVSNELKHTVDMMETEDFDDILQLIDEAQRIFVYGTGRTQYNAALELRREFAYKKKMIYIIDGITEIDTLLNNIQENDLFILMSLSGSGEIITTLSQLLKNMNVKTIGIGLDQKNPLLINSTYYIPFHAGRYQVGDDKFTYQCSNHFFIILNMLYIRYLEYTFEHKKGS